ncbi:Dipeptidyl peptidase 3 [Sarcoptes scabiei]|uniref:Dipeptidyl peptidase 3 n=1 Tax=Sarcoptes scabiei TaxID=52283 RepID=A0A834V8T5_SARSC|nr:Dipeptidyl peptidase 3 [Sarcoptes scabiei]
MAASDNEDIVYSVETPVLCLDAKDAFDGLNEQEKLYVHHLSKASWFGSLVDLFQTSPESPLIFVLLNRLFSSQSISELKKFALDRLNFSEIQWKEFLAYSAAFYANMGNYRSFGDSKFIPELPSNLLENLILNSTAYQSDPEMIKYLWNELKDKIYSLKKEERCLGFYPEGQTTYWSKNINQNDRELVGRFLALNCIDGYNTRVMKDIRNDQLIIRFASVRDSSDAEERSFIDCVDKDHLVIDGREFRLERGDYSGILSLVNKHLEKAQLFASNQIEQSMISRYIEHFRSGSLEAHKNGSRFWIQNLQPVIETYIGFIETYRDPAGQRAEFEGFVAIVNKEMSKKFNELVQNAEELLSHLPWPKVFEKDKFLKPDFTSLDVLTFACSGIPCGINIPNYDEIRQSEGFKNVSFGNVLCASSKVFDQNFLLSEDAQLLQEYSSAAFEIIVGLHELLGHGSGKLLKSTADGKLNFDPSQAIDPIEKNQISCWYNHNETYDSKFGPISSAYEECRAECVGLYLSTNKKVLKIFGFEEEEKICRVVYAAWLQMIQKGIQSLKMYNPTTKKWLQAHSQARYVIMRVLLSSAKPIAKISYIPKSEIDGDPDLLIDFFKDLKLIENYGLDAVGNFLLRLQIYKSTGDIANASKLFAHYSAVDDDLENPYLKFREIVMARKKPRPIFIQSATKVIDSKVMLKTFEPNLEGLIESFQNHFNEESSLEATIIELYKKDSHYFN